MAEDRTLVDYQVNTVYSDRETRLTSSQNVKITKSTRHSRYSANGALLDTGRTEYEDVATMTLREFTKFVADSVQLLGWMSEDSLRFAKQLEDADIKPEEG